MSILLNLIQILMNERGNVMQDEFKQYYKMMGLKVAYFSGI